MFKKLNLIMVYHAGALDPADYRNIRSQIHLQSLHIAVHIARDNLWRGSLPDIPTMTFCPGVIRLFQAPRGHVFCGKIIPKSEQMRLLAKGGIRVPKWTFLKPQHSYKESEWGPCVVVKPNAFGISSFGRALELVKTSSLKYIPPIAYPPGH